jgi:hypothetical protein
MLAPLYRLSPIAQRTLAQAQWVPALLPRSTVTMLTTGFRMRRKMSRTKTTETARQETAAKMVVRARTRRILRAGGGQAAFNVANDESTAR